MIITQCAVCATELGLSLGKKCGRCSTRYCGAECQVQHWKEGGHDQLCKKIKTAGGAEQYNANEKYAEALAVAVEKCADDTKGQTCYICTQALHWKTKEGLVRGCSCRGTAGFAHVSCLAEQAKILMEEAEYNNLGANVLRERWDRWHSCSLCEQEYHGVVRCALGWACWKAYLGRPEADGCRRNAMTLLGAGLTEAHHHEAAVSVKEAELAMMRRLGGSETDMLIVQGNLANAYIHLERFQEKALRLKRDVYSGWKKLNGEEHILTFKAGNNYAISLVDLGRIEEAKSLLLEMTPVARRVLGEADLGMLRMRWICAMALYKDDCATLDDIREAVNTLEELERTARRVLGSAHPTVRDIGDSLRESRQVLSASDASSITDAFAAMTPSPRGS